ncbi:MAG: hypothetical protein WD073_01575 [Xanthobacteraceae bacterium]
MFPRTFIAAAIVAVAISACAKRADQISAAYISPLTFQHLTCPQIAEEAQRISSRAAIITGTQDEKATRDAVAMGVGLIVFWPALFFVGGNDQQTAELARLRGEMEALEQVSLRKNCGIRFQRPAPPPPAPAPSNY